MILRNRLNVSMAGLLAAMTASTAAAQPLAGPDAVRYDGHALVRLDATSPEDLLRLEAAGLTLVSCELSPEGGDFLVPPGVDPGGMGYRVESLAPDVQPMLDAEAARIRASLERLHQRGSGEGFFDDYRPLPEIDAFLDDLVARRPDIVSRFEIGRSHEDRPIWGLRISGGEGEGAGGCKPAFVINGITHAREWLTVMNVLYLADRLVDGHGVDTSITDIVDRVEWFIIPVLNPDGYEFTWTTNRMWRKNRRPEPRGPLYMGVDPNRNYGVGWGRPGSSPAPRSNIYHGPAPFSEPETAALRDFTLANPQVRAHNDVHSYGQYILFPWDHLFEQCPDHDEYQALGDQMGALIQSLWDNDFRVGPTSTTLYLVSGGSIDWFYEGAGAMSFSYELRGGGFNPPPSQIVPGSRETFEATLLHAEYVADRNGFRADLTGDCRHTFDDVVAFLVAFADDDPAADLDGSGSVTFDDVVEFLELFGAAL